MSIKAFVLEKVNLITRKLQEFRQPTSTEHRVQAQKWLNTKKPPQKGRHIKKSVVESAALDSVTLINKKGKVIFSPFSSGILRVYLQSASDKDGWAEQNSWTIDLAGKNTDGWRFKKTTDTAEFSYTLADGSEARFSIELAMGTVSLLLGAELIISGESPQVARGWLLVVKRLRRPGEVRVFGLGENTTPMDKAGQTVVMWNIAPINYEMGANPLYQTWPVALFQYASGPAIGLVFDNPSYASFNFSAGGKKMDYAVQDTDLSYYILPGPTLPEVMRQMALLTGHLPPLPKWSLGYQQSRWSYTPSSRVLEIAAEFRKRDIPCDVIYLDIDYMDHYKCFTWGEGFKDHRDLIRELHGQGFKLVTILDPGLKIEKGYAPYEAGAGHGMFVKWKFGGYVKKWVWAGPSLFPDFINPDTREWWAKLVGAFAVSGVDGIWCDMNEPTVFDCRRTLPPNAIHKLSQTKKVPHGRVHNIYGYLMSMATYKGLLKNTRLPYVLTRSSYLGGQKCAVTWTGDNVASWEHFRASIPMILNLGLSGQPIAGPDIGGFKGKPSPELYGRWILQGSLYPFSRSHTEGPHNQEPWSFGPAVEDAARKSIKLRYRLIPYLYSLLYEAVQSGQPIMRPLFYHDPANEALKPEFFETQFLLGPNLLAAPLMDLAPARACYLPPGTWYTWWGRKKREGGQVFYTVPEEDTDLPLFIREDSVIPVYPEAPAFIPDHSLEALELIVAVQKSAEGLIVEYFDHESLLAYQVRATFTYGFLTVGIDLVQKGVVPPGYRPPETLSIRVNHVIKNIIISSGYKDSSVKPDPSSDSWTLIKISNPLFPLEGFFLPGQY
ncbi:MAG: glycoside hydrolase family 31 protein [Eubacteriales bacterium]